MLGFGLKTSAYWRRFQVQNPTAVPVPWMLEVSYPLLDDEVRVAIKAEPDACVINVEDQGIGISNDDRQKLFSGFESVGG